MVLGIYIIIKDYLFFNKLGLFVFNWRGIILIIIGYAFFLFKDGFKYYPDEKIILNFIEFAGLKLWTKQKLLPKTIDNIMIGKRILTYAPFWAGLTPLKLKSTVFDVYLVHGHHYDRLFSVDQKYAIEYGQIIADSFNVKLITKI